MHRSWIITRCCPALLIVAAGACASRGSTTNVTSAGNVARDTTASTMRSDTASTMRRDTTASTTRDTASTTRRDTTAAMPTTPATTGVQLSVTDAPTGAYVTDASGRAVYVVDAPDSATFTCTGACETDLEPVVGQATIGTGVTGLQASQLGTRALPDGRQQATYNGKPLFFSRSDAAKGDTKGQGTKSYGNVRLLTPTR